MSINLLILFSHTTSAQMPQSKLNLMQTVTVPPPILISLTPDKTGYSIDDTIRVSGEITNDSKPLSNQRIIIEVTEDNRTFHNSSIISDLDGKFEVFFQVPEEGVATVIGSLVGEFPNVQTLITIPVSASWITTTIAIFISTGIITLAVFILQGLKYPRLSLTAAIALTVLAYYLFYIFSDLDPVVKAAFSVALIVPIATYIYESLAKRREYNSGLEDTVGKYRNESITEDIKSVSSINEELSSHQAAFQSAHDEISKNKLSKSIYTSVRRTGLMGHLPGLRVNMYYNYIDSYNNFLEIKITRPGRLQDVHTYENYYNLFKNLKDAYSMLNETLYVNILYTLHGLQERHLSYPTLVYPTRYSGPLLLALLKAGIFGEIETDQNGKINRRGYVKKYDRTNAHELIPVITEEKIKIYNEENAEHLMKLIGDEFNKGYKNLQTTIKELDKFTTNLEIPKVNNQFVSTLRDRRLRINLNGVDPNNLALGYIIISPPSHGLLIDFDLAVGSITYQPARGYVGIDSFSFKASNGFLHSDTAIVTIIISEGASFP